jgi:hypothetical protein
MDRDIVYRNALLAIRVEEDASLLAQISGMINKLFQAVW